MRPESDGWSWGSSISEKGLSWDGKSASSSDGQRRTDRQRCRGGLSGDQPSGARASSWSSSSSGSRGARIHPDPSRRDRSSGDRSSGDPHSRDRSSGDPHSRDRSSGDPHSVDRKSGDWKSRNQSNNSPMPLSSTSSGSAAPTSPDPIRSQLSCATDHSAEQQDECGTWGLCSTASFQVGSGRGIWARDLDAGSGRGIWARDLGVGSGRGIWAWGLGAGSGCRIWAHVLASAAHLLELPPPPPPPNLSYL